MEIVSRVKRSPLAKVFYRFPALVSAYHRFLAWRGRIANKRPSKRIFVIGITGTKGKTTTLELLNAILEGRAKDRAAFLAPHQDRRRSERNRRRQFNARPTVSKVPETRGGRAMRYALVEVTSQGVVLHRHGSLIGGSARSRTLHRAH